MAFLAVAGEEQKLRVERLRGIQEGK